MTEQAAIQLYPGLWYERGGGIATVQGKLFNEDFHWYGEMSNGRCATWTHTGRYWYPHQTDRDLIAPVVAVPNKHGWMPASPPKPSTECHEMKHRICNLCGHDDSDCVCIDGETAVLYRRHLLSQLESAKCLVREIESTLEKLTGRRDQ